MPIDFDFPTLKKLTPSIFDPGKTRWVTAPSAAPGEKIQKDRLRIATFNIWFGELHRKARLKALLDLLQGHEPDIIGLEEVTPETLEWIKADPWVQKYYTLSDITGETVNPYGIFLMSRIPVNRFGLYPLHSWMGRHVLIGEFTINGEDLHAGVVHLESYRSSAPERAIQLGDIFLKLNRPPHSILMGDFNFCATWDENRILDPGYQDLWGVLHPKEPGYTEDTDVNLMRRELKREEKKVRFDRILLRSPDSHWHPISIQMIGTEPISLQHPSVFPSDHFGLVGDIRWHP